MLKGISHLISPDLLKILSEMGHGDEIVLADAHFPGKILNSNTIRADGIKIADLLEAILPLFELDSYSPSPLVMMAAVEGDELDPEVERNYLAAIKKTIPDPARIARIDRFEFYEIAKSAHSIVVTGELSKYGNIILKKGVTPC